MNPEFVWYAALFFAALIFLHFLAGWWAARSLKNAAAPELPGVSVIKPIKGADEATYHCLASWCRQAYPGPYEVIFSLQDEHDPALEVIDRLKRDFPGTQMRTFVNPVRLGMSGKTSNLFYGVEEAAYPYLIFSDADMTAEPDTAARLVSPLADERAVLAAAIPVHRRGRGFWGLLYQLQVNVTVLGQWLPWGRILPLGVSGGTLALSKSILEEIGGVESFGSYLLDDVKIGLLVREAGHRIELGPLIEAYTGEKAPADTSSFLARGAAIYRFMLGPVLTVFYFIGAYFYYLAWLLALVTGSEAAFWAGLSHLVLKTATLWLLSRVVAGTSGVEALYTLILDSIMVYLLLKVSLTRQVHWRGTVYTIDGKGRIIRGRGLRPQT